MLTQSEAEARVQRGIEYLDRTEPGWHARIDLSRFDLIDGCRCVLGQVFGTCGSISGFRRQVRLEGKMRDGVMAVERGFDVYDSETTLEDYGVVEEVWIAAIRSLQSPVEREVTRSGAVAAEMAIAK